MSKSLSVFLSAILFVFISSCSSNEEKNNSPDEITNFLLVSEQLPIKTLSNALEWPEEIILGIELDLIELNEEGKERLDDIFEEYSDEVKDDFINDYKEKKWKKFVKSDWIKSETTKISKTKINLIKEHEFKNNQIIQNKLNNCIPYYIKKQTEDLSSYELSFFSKNFWMNLGQISWMHVRSTYGKISNKDVSYLKPNYKQELQIKWQRKFKEYFSTKSATTEIGNILYNYQKFNTVKYNFLTKLINKRLELNSFINDERYIIKNNLEIDIKPIISHFNLTMIDNFGLLFTELLIGLLILTFVNFLIRRISKKEYETRQNILVTFFNTGVSPFKVVLGSTAFLGNVFFSNKKKSRIQSRGSTINSIIGLILLIFSICFISKEQIKLENEINANFESNFSSYFDYPSINVLDDLNLNTELFFISI